MSGSKKSDHVTLCLNLAGPHLVERILSVLPCGLQGPPMSWPPAPSWPPFLHLSPAVLCQPHRPSVPPPPHSCLGAFVLGFHCFENVLTQPILLESFSPLTDARLYHNVLIREAFLSFIVDKLSSSTPACLIFAFAITTILQILYLLGFLLFFPH